MQQNDVLFAYPRRIFKSLGSFSYVPWRIRDSRERWCMSVCCGVARLYLVASTGSRIAGLMRDALRRVATKRAGHDIARFRAGARVSLDNGVVASRQPGYDDHAYRVSHPRKIGLPWKPTPGGCRSAGSDFPHHCDAPSEAKTTPTVLCIESVRHKRVLRGGLRESAMGVRRGVKRRRCSGCIGLTWGGGCERDEIFIGG